MTRSTRSCVPSAASPVLGRAAVSLHGPRRAARPARRRAAVRSRRSGPPPGEVRRVGEVSTAPGDTSFAIRTIRGPHGHWGLWGAPVERGREAVVGQAEAQ